jgi:hypothetical protein
LDRKEGGGGGRRRRRRAGRYIVQRRNKTRNQKELWNECETFKLGVCVCAVLVRIPPELLDGGK